MSQQPTTHQIGRVIRLTEDGYLAINLSAKSKNIKLIFRNNKPLLEYKVGREVKTHSLNFANIPILEGSTFCGCFTGEEYDASALAALMNIPEDKVTDKTHQMLIELVGKAKINFFNPYPKPKRNADKTSQDYNLWKTMNDSLWEKACVIKCFDPLKEAERQRNAEAAKQNTGGANGEQDSSVDAIDIAIEQNAVFTATTLFDTGVEGVNGLNDTLKLLRTKGINHEQFRLHCINLLKIAYYDGLNDFEDDLRRNNALIVGPLVNFLHGLKTSTLANLENSKSIMTLDEETQKQFTDQVTQIDTFIEQLTSLLPVEEEETGEQNESETQKK